MAASKNNHCLESSRAQPEGSPSLIESVAAFISPRLVHGQRICVALSGGRDSVVLLHAMAHIVARDDRCSALSALHVHHGISPNADEWARFCAELCGNLGVPLCVVHVEVPRASREGLEGAARRLRHGEFAKADAEWLALGHHRDDQAETVLLNLLRGAGVAGAAGMLSERTQQRGPTLVRPLLGVPRDRIAAYAADHGLRWIDDESNDDRRFRRNYLRGEILPALECHFPGAGRSLARAAGHFAEASTLLDDLAQIDRTAVIAPSGRLGLAAFNELPAARARNLLRYVWVAAGLRAPDTVWLDEALRQLARTRLGASTCVATPEGALRVYREELYVVPRVEKSVEAVRWQGEATLPWGGGCVRLERTEGAGISESAIAVDAVWLRPRQGGEHLQPQLARPRRSLRNLLQESGVPPWERPLLPYLWCGDRLAWVGDLGVDAAFACGPGEPGVLPVWERAGQLSATGRGIEQHE